MAHGRTDSRNRDLWTRIYFYCRKLHFAVSHSRGTGNAIEAGATRVLTNDRMIYGEIGPFFCHALTLRPVDLNGDGGCSDEVAEICGPGDLG